jgi:hypothetical protein
MRDHDPEQQPDHQSQDERDPMAGIQAQRHPGQEDGAGQPWKAKDDVAAG